MVFVDRATTRKEVQKSCLHKLQKFSKYKGRMQENIKRLFADCFAYLGEQALYESRDKSYMVEILKQQPDKLYGIGEGQFVGEILTLEVSVFDVLKPMVGDTFSIGSCRYRVHSPPLRDNSGIIWKIRASNAY